MIGHGVGPASDGVIRGVDHYRAGRGDEVPYAVAMHAIQVLPALALAGAALLAAAYGATLLALRHPAASTRTVKDQRGPGYRRNDEYHSQ